MSSSRLTNAARASQEGRLLIEQLKSMTSARLMVIDIDATLQAAARSFSKPGIGLVIVCRGSGEAAGVLSKSDLVRHLANSGSADTPVEALMSRPIVSCRPDDDVHSMWQTMAGRRLQNMPVLGADSIPVGTLDAMKALIEQEEFEERLLTNYIAGIGYQ